ncbi:hypothetical protein [Enterobacter kobei]|uniref:hypothetical protein n=1 Tax=Enterobacter kobei TaxID=208224 RepID=UPI0020205869|nr:hypothetical protein [Enterobacter kobei]MCL8167140.1 hypothetical protein [Enterobacter kobei]MCM7795636.1 hypothetical protein [Enterobacter kobei]
MSVEEEIRLIKKIPPLVRYSDGLLYWVIKPSYSRNKGDEAGGKVGGKYRAVQYDHTVIYIHRIIFFMFHGYLPRRIRCIDKTLDSKGCYSFRIENLEAEK